MTDSGTLTAAIIGAAGIIGGAVKWASSQLTRAQDRGIAALIKSAESNATLAAKFDTLMTRFDALMGCFNHLVEVLRANGIGVGAAAAVKLGRAPTAPLSGVRRIAEDPDGED